MTPKPKRATCGIIITDGQRVLLGHATRSPRWDIPKGLAEPDEPHLDAARRELAEETGLDIPAAELIDLGVHRYLGDKDLALFAHERAVLPDPATLTCRSLVIRPNGDRFPEIDRFAILPWPIAIARTGRRMAAVLTTIAIGRGWLPADPR